MLIPIPKKTLRIPCSSKTKSRLVLQVGYKFVFMHVIKYFYVHRLKSSSNILAYLVSFSLLLNAIWYCSLKFMNTSMIKMRSKYYQKEWLRVSKSLFFFCKHTQWTCQSYTNDLSGSTATSANVAIEDAHLEVQNFRRRWFFLQLTILVLPKSSRHLLHLRVIYHRWKFMKLSLKFRNPFEKVHWRLFGFER